MTASLTCTSLLRQVRSLRTSASATCLVGSDLISRGAACWSERMRLRPGHRSALDRPGFGRRAGRPSRRLLGDAERADLRSDAGDRPAGDARWSTTSRRTTRSVRLRSCCPRSTRSGRRWQRRRQQARSDRRVHGRRRLYRCRGDRAVSDLDDDRDGQLAGVHDDHIRHRDHGDDCTGRLAGGAPASRRSPLRRRRPCRASSSSNSFSASISTIRGRIRSAHRSGISEARTRRSPRRVSVGDRLPNSASCGYVDGSLKNVVQKLNLATYQYSWDRLVGMLEVATKAVTRVGFAVMGAELDFALCAKEGRTTTSKAHVDQVATGERRRRREPRAYEPPDELDDRRHPLLVLRVDERFL